MEVLLCNLTFEKILGLLINIAIILALIHYVVLPLGRSVGEDVKGDQAAVSSAGYEQQLGTN